MNQLETKLPELLNMLKTAESTIQKDKLVLLMNSSSKAKKGNKKRNKTKICGKNPKMANKPERTPSQINPLSQAGAASIAPPTASIMAEKDISKKLKRMTPGELIPASVQNKPS